MIGPDTGTRCGSRTRTSYRRRKRKRAQGAAAASGAGSAAPLDPGRCAAGRGARTTDSRAGPGVLDEGDDQGDDLGEGVAGGVDVHGAVGHGQQRGRATRVDPVTGQQRLAGRVDVAPTPLSAGPDASRAAGSALR